MPDGSTLGSGRCQMLLADRTKQQPWAPGPALPSANWTQPCSPAGCHSLTSCFAVVLVYRSGSCEAWLLQTARGEPGGAQAGGLQPAGAARGPGWEPASAGSQEQSRGWLCSLGSSRSCVFPVTPTGHWAQPQSGVTPQGAEQVCEASQSSRAGEENRRRLSLTVLRGRCKTGGNSTWLLRAEGGDGGRRNLGGVQTSLDKACPAQERDRWPVGPGLSRSVAARNFLSAGHSGEESSLWPSEHCGPHGVPASLWEGCAKSMARTRLQGHRGAAGAGLPCILHTGVTGMTPHGPVSL